MIQQIKDLRVETDGLAQLTKGLKPIKVQKYAAPNRPLPVEKQNSKEIEKAVDSLYLAKAWLGKLLGELGTTNPYGSGYKTKEDIVPTQDVFEDYYTDYKFYHDKNHIEKVDWLRAEVELIVSRVKELPTQGLTREFAIARTNAYNHLCEARMWLGFELQRIKEENN